MSIVCPSCDARFREPPAAVAVGRALQCSRCDHLFTRADAGLIEIEAPSMVPTLEAVCGRPVTADAKVADTLLAGGDGEAIRSALPVVVVARRDKPVAKPVYVDIEPEPERIARWRWAMPVLAAGLLWAATVALAARIDIMHRFPATVPLYQTAGLAPSHPGLAIAGVVTERQEQDGIARLIVRGRIENVARHAVPVPRLQLTLRGREETSLHAWTVAGADRPLEAGAKRSFTAVAQDVPEGTVDVKVRFMARER